VCQHSNCGFFYVHVLFHPSSNLISKTIRNTTQGHRFPANVFQHSCSLSTARLGTPGRCSCLIFSNFSLTHSPQSKHPAFSLKMHIFPKQTAAHIVDEQSVPTWLLSTYCKTRKRRVTPFLCHTLSVPFMHCKLYSILFSLLLHCDHHSHLSKIKFKYKSHKSSWKTVSCSQNICLSFLESVAVDTSP